MIISVCGKSCSGKTSLCKAIVSILGEDKAVHLDIDEVGHRVLAYPQIVEEIKTVFGDSVISSNSVDRVKLGDLIFTSRSDMKQLTNIVWGIIQKEIDEFIELNKDKKIILDWILLPHTKYFSMSDFKILMDGNFKGIRRNRAMKRDGICAEDFDKRDSASIEYNLEEFDAEVCDFANSDIISLARGVLECMKLQRN